VLYATLLCLHAGAAAAQGDDLTLAGVLARARAQAPQIVSARLALEETRARLVGASLRSQTNPDFDFFGGRRTGAGGAFADFEVALGQTFEPSSRRAARRAGATAAVAQAVAGVDDVTRTVLRDAAAAYFRAVHANHRIALLDAAEALASNVHATADRRFRTGDIAVLDVNIARAALARVRADREGAEAARAVVVGELRQLLRLDGELTVAGSLASPSTDIELVTALAAARERPELRSLEAAVAEAGADLRSGVSLTKPQFGVGARYSREEGDQVLLGGLTITLPLFSNGQEQRAAASARTTRLRAELAAATSRVQAEVRAAFDTYTRRRSAVRILETDAAPGLDENEQLTVRSFDAGQSGLPDLLLIRREILETRFQYLDALLEAALARIELDASAAMLR
jgi:cobalt-zinc-cadmium efflux system outer membrane protein